MLPLPPPPPPHLPLLPLVLLKEPLPLHVGFTGDAGGNSIIVRWFRRKTNLHHVWDNMIIESAMNTFYNSDLTTFIEAIQKNITGIYLLTPLIISIPFTMFIACFSPLLSLEISLFEMMVLLSGLLPNPKLETSVLSISLNTCSLVYMISLGLSGATRVSNELGAGRPIAARFALRVAVSLVAIEGTLAAATMILGRRLWGYCYSREEEVVSYVAEMLLLIAGSHFLDGIQSILSGAVRGCGRQKIGAIVNLGAYYLIGMPTAILLAFIFHLGGKNRPSSGFNSPYFTTNSGAPVWNNNSSLTVGTRDTSVNLLIVTKTWPEDIIPLQPVGRMVLNKNIDNFFAENEQLAFCPAIIVHGYSSKHL